jgi:uncharacterized protein YndB with AHSA1/START domain
MDAPDEVRRAMEIRAPRERVWTAITPAELLRWFPTRHANVDPRPGGTAPFASA